MRKQYTHYTNITRDILDTIKVGDLVKVNNWRSPMAVKAVSNNYFVMTQTARGKHYYSVCSKLPWCADGVVYNKMRGGMFHCSTDDRLFGSALQADYQELYQFENEEANNKYLMQFELGEVTLSERNGIAIYDLYVKAIN
jgi:hypothetical protein